MAFPNLVYETELQPSEVRLAREGDDLILRHEGTTEQVVFADYFAEGWLVQEIHLEPNAEGVVLRRAEVDAALANGGVVPDGVVIEGAGTLAGTAYHDTLIATEAGTTLLGGGGNDSLESFVADGFEGAVFEGGEGSDMLGGSVGGDVYRFNRGDGFDVIVDRVGDHGQDAVALVQANPDDARLADRIEFGAGIRPDDLVVVKLGETLRLYVAGGDDAVQILDWYGNGALNKIEEIAFVGGTVWHPADVEALALDGLAAFRTGITLTGPGALSGTLQSDTLTATGFGTVLDGFSGEDRLVAAVDPGVFGLTFIGGAGSDVMIGSYGGDTYRYTIADGDDLIRDDVRALGPDVAAFFAAHPDAASYQDRLEFGDGIAATDVRGERVGDDLLLHVNGDQGSITIDGWYDGTRFNKIETIAFADGTAWTAADIDHRLGEASPGLTASGGGTLAGTAYDDVLTATGFGTVLAGGAGNDHLAAQADGSVFGLTFQGGAGDDVLTGSYAGDVYRYALGDGNDVIRDDVRVLGAGVADFFAAQSGTASYQDRIVFEEGVDRGDVSGERIGDDLLLHVGDAASAGSIRIEGWYDGTMFNKIESLVFADGTILLANEVDRLTGQASIGVTASGGGALAGSQYDDVLVATGFGTVLSGGTGNDRLSAASDGGVFGVVFEGGRGDDQLTGSYAGDVYRYNLGDATDVIHDDVRALGPDVAAFFAAHPGADSYQDRVEFGAGIAADAVGGERVGDDLVLRMGADGGALVVAGWYDGTLFNKIESFVFADGTTWLASDIDHRLGEASIGLQQAGGGTLAGSQYDDSLTATGYGAQLEGNAGNDTLAAGVDGGIFDVHFAGGRGDDLLVGSYARDFYHYDRGDGSDVILDDVRALSSDVAAFFQAHPDADTYQDQLLFGAGIAAGDVTRERVGADLVLGLGGHDSVTVSGWFDGTVFNKIELIGFADGTTWTAAMAEQGLA